MISFTTYLKQTLKWANIRKQSKAKSNGQKQSKKERLKTVLPYSGNAEKSLSSKASTSIRNTRSADNGASDEDRASTIASVGTQGKADRSHCQGALSKRTDSKNLTFTLNQADKQLHNRSAPCLHNLVPFNPNGTFISKRPSHSTNTKQQQTRDNVKGVAGASKSTPDPPSRSTTLPRSNTYHNPAPLVKNSKFQNNSLNAQGIQSKSLSMPVDEFPIVNLKLSKKELDRDNLLENKDKKELLKNEHHLIQAPFYLPNNNINIDDDDWSIISVKPPPLVGRDLDECFNVLEPQLLLSNTSNSINSNILNGDKKRRKKKSKSLHSIENKLLLSETNRIAVKSHNNFINRGSENGLPREAGDKGVLVNHQNRRSETKIAQDFTDVKHPAKNALGKTTATTTPQCHKRSTTSDSNRSLVIAPDGENVLVCASPSMSCVDSQPLHKSK